MSLSDRQQAVLSSYLSNLWRGPHVVREMIVHDFRSFMDLGAHARAAETLAVLERFAADYPKAKPRHRWWAPRLTIIRQERCPS
jgi:hypothetical protein